MSNNRWWVQVARYGVPADAPLPLRIARVALHDRWLLAIASTTALGVTALQRTPEAIPFGYEIGVFVSSVAYAYVGAWIFNWVIVVRPREQQLRGIYLFTWEMLSLAARDGETLVRSLQYLADADPRVEAEDDDIGALCRQIPYGRDAPDNEDPVEYLRSMLALFKPRLDAYMPLLVNAEQPLLSAIADLNKTVYISQGGLENFSKDGERVWVHRLGRRGENKPPTMMTLYNQSGTLTSYYDATRNLLYCMQHTKHAPGPVGRGLRGSFSSELWEERKLYSLRHPPVSP